ncbi:MAG: pyridoxal 5'-phosphate synthase glutaminase subunit PdxT [Anaerolineae bacterium]|nr:pyridoxal 5'-phosphate synthase glutaminase subunit PdxT [Anaerolineae bacterium]
MSRRIGVLALQGAFIEHQQLLARLGAEPVPVRMPAQLEQVTGLIIPGGESTTIGQIAGRWGLLEPLHAFGRSGRPIWGTCAGMILMAQEVLDGKANQPLLGLMDVAVRRNAFGRQVDSFEAELEVPVLGAAPFHAVFIRAPLIERVGQEVTVLATLQDGSVVAVQQGNLLATAFHPELTDDERFHRYFLRLV